MRRILVTSYFLTFMFGIGMGLAGISCGGGLTKQDEQAVKTHQQETARALAKCDAIAIAVAATSTGDAGLIEREKCLVEAGLR